MKNMDKVYEIIVNGYIEGGYYDQTQKVGIFATLDDAKAALKRGIDVRRCDVESWYSFGVIEVTLGEIDGGKLVYETPNVRFSRRGHVIERELSPEEEDAIDELLKRGVDWIEIDKMIDDGMPIDEIVDKYND